VIGKPKRLAGASFTNVVVKLSPSQLSALRGAKADVHVRGFSSAVALDDGAQALNTWQRTCPVHKS
jgi:hypothetical protein